MKKLFMAVVLAMIFVLGWCVPDTYADETGEAAVAPHSFANQDDAFSYAVGIQIGKSLQTKAFAFNRTVFMQAVGDVLDEKELVLTEPQIRELMKELSAKLQQEQQEKFKEESDKNIAEDKAFLEKNAMEEGIKSTASGLQYKVIEEGDGPLPKETDTVKVHYRGTFIDGEEFDSSYERGEPVTFPLNRVITGWTEGLQLIKVGSKAKLYIPSDLAYGPEGNRGIPPNKMLIFDVELLGIEEAAQAPQGQTIQLQ